MIDRDVIRCAEFAPVERSVTPSYGRPRLRVSRSFAGEVAGVKFRKGRFEVVGVECDMGHEPPVGVNLGDAERVGVECLGPLVSAG